MKRQERQLKNFQEFCKVVHAIRTSTGSRCALRYSKKPKAVLRTGHDTLKALLAKFERASVALLGEQRRPGESPHAYFERISTLSESGMAALIFCNEKGGAENAR